MYRGTVQGWWRDESCKRLGARNNRLLLGGRRRLGGEALDLHPPVFRPVLRIRGIARPVPPDARRRELIRLQRWELSNEGFLHTVRAVQRELLHQALRHLSSHRAVGVPFDDDACRAELSG